MKKVFSLSLISMISLVALTGCVEEYKTQTVKGIVIEKEYDKPEVTYTTKTVDGQKVKKKKVKPEEYEVTIQYKSLEREFEDESLYDRVKEGQEIDIVLKQGFDKKGNLVTESIELPKK